MYEFSEGEEHSRKPESTVLGIPGIFPAFLGKNECEREGVDQVVASVPGFVNSSLWEILLSSASALVTSQAQEGGVYIWVSNLDFCC